MFEQLELSLSETRKSFADQQATIVRLQGELDSLQKEHTAFRESSEFALKELRLDNYKERTDLETELAQLQSALTAAEQERGRADQLEKVQADLTEVKSHLLTIIHLIKRK